MGKSIKKRYKLIIAIPAILLLIFVTAYLLVRSPGIQTYIVKRVTATVGKNLNASISIGKVHYSFFNKLAANDVSVTDNYGDTLLYAKEIKVGMRRISRKGKLIHLSKISISSPVFQIIADSSGTTNLSLILSGLIKKNENPDSVGTRVLINHIELTEGIFSINLAHKEGGKKDSGIDFNNMRVSDIDAIIEDFRVSNDTTSMYIYRASFKEKNGFVTNRLSGNVSISSTGIRFNDIEIMTPESSVKGEIISLTYDDNQAFKNFLDEVRLRINLEPSIIEPADIAFFAPALKLNTGPLEISGNITGTVSQLRGRNLSILGGNSTDINCDFDFSGLPDIDNTYLFVNVNNLTTRFSELETLGLLSENKLPAGLDDETGIMTFRGTFSGFVTDFVTYGSLFTSAGTLSTDISFRPSGKNSFMYEGMLKGTAVDAGKLTGNKTMLGKATFQIDLDGSSRSLKDFDAVLDGKIESAEVNGYVYSDIVLDGNFTEKTWDGSVSIKDENLVLDFIGMLDFQNEKPQFDFSLNIPKSNLFYLNLDKADSSTSASMLLTANFEGNNIDNVSGEIKLLNSTLSRRGRTLDIFDGSLRTWTDEGSRSMEFTSDFFKASLRGNYNFGSMPETFRALMARLIPSQFDMVAPTSEPAENSFELTVELFDTDGINSFFDTGIEIAEGTLLKLDYNNDYDIRAEVSSDHFSYGNQKINMVAISAAVSDSVSGLRLTSESANLAGRIGLNKFGVRLSTSPDSLRVLAEWDQSQELTGKGSLGLQAGFFMEDSSRYTSVMIGESEIMFANQIWKINPSGIILKKGNISINDLLINNGDNYYRLHGVISENKTDTLHLDFDGINLGSLNNFTESGDPDKLRLTLAGELSGRVLLTGILGEFMLETDNVMVESFQLMDHNYGNLFLNSEWDNHLKVAGISLYNDLDGVRALDIEGTYDPEKTNINLSAKADRLPINILNPVLSSFASGIKGFASGSVLLAGKINQPVLTGSLYVEEGSMKVDYLQTQYFFNDSIRFSSHGILFDEITASDDRGNPIKIDGTITHKNFRDYGIDLTFNPAQAKVLDTRIKDNDIFYGTAFASGVISIKSGSNNLAFDISARTDRNTRFFVPMNSSQSISDYSFVTFTGSDIPLSQDQSVEARKETTSTGSTISLNFDLDVTPDAEVQLVLDAKAGDVMRGRGSGKLNIVLTPKGDFSISGDYIISSGDYLFTLGNILNKRFSVEEGSRISWNGEITEADIDISAKYRLEASLFDLLQDERFRDRIPVECILHMTDRLVNPSIDFEINLPTADEQTRSYLRNAINTDEEMSRQFVYLLVMNRFYPDPAYRSGGSSDPASGAGSSALGNTMEMVSNQLTNWLSQISNDFDVGFVYRPGNEISTQEVELALSTQLLNDRVTINGNFDVGAAQNNSSATTVTGVFDVEFAITEKLKFKFFNRSNDNILYETAPYTQGIGIFFRHDFDKFKYFFRRKNIGDARKED